MCRWGWCWTGLCVVVARVDNDVPFVIWPDLCKFEQKGCVYKNKKKNKKTTKNWKPAGVVCFFLILILILFFVLSLWTVLGCHFPFKQKDFRNFSNCSLFFVLHFLLFPRTQYPCRIQNCLWLCLCLFIDLYIEILFYIVHSLLLGYRLIYSCIYK